MTETRNVCRNRDRSSDFLLGKPKNKICSICTAVVTRNSQLMISVTWRRKFLNRFLEEEEQQEEEQEEEQEEGEGEEEEGGGGGGGGGEEEEEEEEEAVLDAYAVIDLVFRYVTKRKVQFFSDVLHSWFDYSKKQNFPVQFSHFVDVYRTFTALMPSICSAAQHTHAPFV